MKNFKRCGKYVTFKPTNEYDCMNALQKVT